MPSPVATGTGLSPAAGQQAMGTENGGTAQGAQSTTSSYPGPNAPYTVQRNQMGSTNEGSSAVMAERVIESTYRNYPQQAGQPAIIINNIIVPADVHGGKSQYAQRSGDDVSQADLKEYAEFKEWLRYKRGLSGTSHMAPEPMKPAKSMGFNREPSDSYQEAVSSDGRLSFKDRFAEKPTRNSGMWVIPVAGIHASNFNADFQDGQYDGRAGWNAGLDFRLRVRKFFMQPGIHYFSSSMNVTREDSISTAPLLTGPRIHSLKAPLLAGVYLTQAKGGFFRFNIKGGVVGHYVLNVDQNDDNRFDKDNIEDFSYGLNAGIGLEFGFLTIDLSHEWGMSPLFKDSNQKNNILRATVGFKL
ncbi:porin family protein [Dyadobacter sp. 32]|uniref:porin family protein n=1 Tax=Dyadobacter sp. 32 TaxID=538966 RepID=UPI0011EFA755